MADCLSGVWAYHAYKERSLLDLRIFDRLFAQLSVERAAQTDTATEVIFLRVKIPTEQRSKWFAAGFNSGETKSCDTFRR
jgi:predicted metalloprotease